MLIQGHPWSSFLINSLTFRMQAVFCLYPEYLSFACFLFSFFFCFCLFVSGCFLLGQCFTSLSYSADFIETIHCELISLFYDSPVRLPLESLVAFHNKAVYSLKPTHANEYISIGRGNLELNTKFFAIGLEARWPIVKTMLPAGPGKTVSAKLWTWVKCEKCCMH